MGIGEVDWNTMIDWLMIENKIIIISYIIKVDGVEDNHNDHEIQLF